MTTESKVTGRIANRVFVREPLQGSEIDHFVDLFRDDRDPERFFKLVFWEVLFEMRKYNKIRNFIDVEADINKQDGQPYRGTDVSFVVIRTDGSKVPLRVYRNEDSLPPIGSYPKTPHVKVMSNFLHDATGLPYIKPFDTLMREGINAIKNY